MSQPTKKDGTRSGATLRPRTCSSQSPAGYETTGQQGFGSYPDFYVPIEPAAGKPGKLRADFRLRTVPQSQQNFTLLLVGDPQSDSDQQIVRYERETIADMKRTLGQAGTYTVAIALGDVRGPGVTGRAT